MSAPRKLTPEQTAEAAQLYATTDITLDELGRRYGVGGKVMHKRVRSLPGYKAHRARKVTREQVEAMRAASEAGESQRSIARRFGVDSSTVRRWVGKRSVCPTCQRPLPAREVTVVE